MLISLCQSRLYRQPRQLSQYICHCNKPFFHRPAGTASPTNVPRSSSSRLLPQKQSCRHRRLATGLHLAQCLRIGGASHHLCVCVCVCGRSSGVCRPSSGVCVCVGLVVVCVCVCVGLVVVCVCVCVCAGLAVARQTEAHLFDCTQTSCS